MSAELDLKYLEYLQSEHAPSKIPYIECVSELTEKIPVTYETTSFPGTVLPGSPTWEILRDINIKTLNKSRENIVQVYQRALPITKFGRLRGNMAYVEDAWNVQIQPLAIKYAYLKNNLLTLSDAKQAKIRDKYLKVRVRYDGKQYVIINAIKTYFTVSYA
jgi:hypothetical protein